MTEITPWERAAPNAMRTLIERYYPAASLKLRTELANCLVNLVAALPLLDALLRADRCKRFASPQRLLDELRQQSSDQARAFEGPGPQPHPPAISQALNNIGRLLHDALQLAPARAAFELALAHDEATAGPEHWWVARDLNRLGTVLHDMGELETACQLYERALRIDHSALGPEHPALARDCNNLALLLRDAGEPDQACRLLQQAAAIAEASLGYDHPYCKILERNLWQLEQESY